MTLIYNGHEFKVNEDDFSLTVDGSTKGAENYQVSVTNDKQPVIIGLTDKRTGTFIDVNGENMTVTNINNI